jgi:hypothetical protein
LEGFAKIYTYPYGNSFVPRDSSLNQPYPEQQLALWNNVTEPPALEHTISGVAVFERSLLRKRNLRPFHVDCRVTQKRVCYCPTFKGGNHFNKEMKVKSMMIASDLMNYYDGYEVDQ